MTDGTGTTSFGYDSLDRLTGHTNGRGDSVSYGWDLAGRLTRITYPDGTTVARGHDAADHPVQLTVHGAATDQTFDAAGQLTGVSDGLADYTFSYGARGNRTAKHDADGVAVASYAYDQANHLVAADEATYAHDGSGLRASADGPSRARAFTWSRAQGLPTLLGDGDRRYATGPGGLTGILGVHPGVRSAAMARKRQAQRGSGQKAPWHHKNSRHVRSLDARVLRCARPRAGRVRRRVTAEVISGTNRVA